MENISSIFGGILVILVVALVVAAVVYFFMSLIFAIWKPTDETKEKVPSPKKRMPVYAIILSAIMLFSLLLGNCLLFFGVQHVNSLSAKTSATVAAINTTREENDIYYSVTVQFQANGQNIVADNGVQSTNRPPMNVGDTVTVYYNPDNPYSIFVPNFDIFILLWIGLCFCFSSEVPLFIGVILCREKIIPWHKFMAIFDNGILTLKMLLVLFLSNIIFTVSLGYIMFFSMDSFNTFVLELLH